MGPFITMVILMALIGFITSINQQFQAPMQAAFLQDAGDMTNTLTTFINFSFFLAYLIMGPTSARTLEKKGYKQALLVGIALLVLALAFFEFSAIQYVKWPVTFNFGSIVLPLSYFIFIIGSFIAGTGLTYLQASVNPYIVACDVKGTSGVQRQSIAGAGNSVMTTLGPLFIAFVVFGGASGADIKVQSLFIPMVVLIAFVAILYFIVRRLNLPNLAGTSVAKDEKLSRSVWSFSHLSLGVIAIFMYVGVEVAVGSNINLYAIKDHGYTTGAAAQLASMYWFGMLIGRLCGSFISKISANTQLVFTTIGAGVLVTLSMFTGNPLLLVFVGLFHSIMWPAIFALAIDKLGKYTAKGSGALMMGVVGGAVLPLIQGIFADSIGSWQWTWTIVVIGEVYLLYYALVGHKVKQLPEDFDPNMNKVQ
ncbi:MFS transporter [Porphyromonas pogonae]|uniref:MFS transporter n=1 Tax=Porphyromonas pogonae TaxID=867595 RepID=UPI002E75DA3C|nr:MFS transporter [Porphyromonas pogonae]